MGRSMDSVEREFEEFKRRFVGLGLLCGYDLIEVNPELRARAGEEIVVHIGEDRQPKACLELPKSSDRVGPRLPPVKRVGQRADFFGAWSEAKLPGELADHGL